jgi:hypothetical protein
MRHKRPTFVQAVKDRKWSTVESHRKKLSEARTNYVKSLFETAG